MEEVKRIFKPEFINRIDEIIVFHSLTQDNIKSIVKIMIASITKRAKEQMDITLDIEDEVISHISEVGFDANYGARPLRRAIQTNIEDKLAESLLGGSIAKGDIAKIAVIDKEIQITKK